MSVLELIGSVLIGGAVGAIAAIPLSYLVAAVIGFFEGGN